MGEREWKRMWQSLGFITIMGLPEEGEVVHGRGARVVR
jgi:hypothetical protein